MSLKYILPFLLGLFFLAACSGKDNRPVKESVSAFMNGNGNVISFGMLDYQSILDKAEYKSIPKFGKLIAERMGNVLDTKSPVYFVVEGPVDNVGNPAATYAFFDVKNRDSLVELLGSSGLHMEDEGDMKYYAEGDVCVGSKGKLAIMIAKKGDFDAKTLLAAAFDKVGGDVSGGKTDKLLDKKGDFVINANLQNLYGGSNTDLAKLDESKKQELKAMMKDSYMNTTLNFEKGRIILTSENMFSDALQKRMFFKEDGRAKILNQLGKGKALAGFAVNVDMQKVESLIDDFAPEFKERMINQRTEYALAAMVLGDGPLAKIVSGYAGIVAVSEPSMMTGIVPEFNFNVGVGKEGRSIIELAAASKLQNFTYTVTDTDLTGHSPNAGAGATALEIPACGKDFGKAGFTGFIDFEGLNLQSFGLPRAYSGAYLLKNITFKVTNKGSEIIINTVNKDQNVLKQVIDLYVKDIEKAASMV